MSTQQALTRTEKQCSMCKDVKPLDDFDRIKKRNHLYESRCRKCEEERWEAYKLTLNYALHNILIRAKHNSSLRAQKGRLEASEVSLTYQDLVDMWNEQEGKCYYSGLPMTFLPNSNWKVSPDRQNPTKGYLRVNVALVALEFNCSSQWSKERLHEAYTLSKEGVLDQELWEKVSNCLNVTRKPPRPKQFVQVSIRDGIRFVTCTFCDIEKIDSEFGKVLSSGCKACIHKRDMERKYSPRSYFLLMLKGARARTKDRNAKGRQMTCDITLEDLVNQYIKQQGRCAYTGIPLRFHTHDEDGKFIISLERIDVTKGYNKDNILLICREFNNFDFRSNGAAESCNWTAEKWQTVMKSLELKYAESTNSSM